MSSPVLERAPESLRSSAVRRLVARLHEPRPLVCGIVNVTPDSFCDGGRYLNHDAAIGHALSLVAEGAEMLDIGGESTRPGAVAPSEAAEIDRVVPVIEALARSTSVPISVDTSRATVMREAVGAGAALVNDVRALRLPDALRTVADLQVPVCLMHMAGEPGTMQNAPTYSGVVREVRAFLTERVVACLRAGIPANHILLDPGFGFGKTVEQNVELLAQLTEFADAGFPVLVGLSRKSMLGAITHRPVEQRQIASAAAALIAAQHGARVLRVHDVAETVDALAVLRAVESAKTRPSRTR